MLEQIVETRSPPVAVATLHDQVEKTIADLQLHLSRDGGNIELVAVDGDMVVLDMKGNCSGCILASVTLAGVRKRLIEVVGRPLKVIPLSAYRKARQ